MSTQRLIWVVDDEPALRFVLAQALRDAGHAVQAFADAGEVLAALDVQRPPELLFSDVRMPGDDGLALLQQFKTHHPQVPVVVMSAYTDVASTAGAFRGGASEFLSKPFDLDAATALAERLLQSATPEPAPGVDADTRHEDATLLGASPPMQTLFRAIGRAAAAPVTVLITGETGTGKELVARALHRESPRARQPFIALNTAAIPAELLESELFGHEAGAFTGAQRRHVGRFEQAEGGTLFLDEIGDMPMPLQTRLLRVLSEGTFFRVGGRALIQADVRIIAATHQPLAQRVEEGRFRADLLHRLDVVRLHVPPLRERRSDIPSLAEHFLSVAARQMDLPGKRLSDSAVTALQGHAWPGNVRELQNLCWRLTTLAPGAGITATDVHAALQGSGTRDAQAAQEPWTQALGQWAQLQLQAGTRDLHAHARAQLDQTLMHAALEHAQGHRGKAAQALGLGRNAIARTLGSARKPR